jgi:hypothetical protein
MRSKYQARVERIPAFHAGSINERSGMFVITKLHSSDRDGPTDEITALECWKESCLRRLRSFRLRLKIRVQIRRSVKAIRLMLYG